MKSELVERLHELRWKPRDLGGFMGRAGPLWTRREGEAWEYGLLAEDRHLNPAGVVHGGALVTLIDHVLSTVAWEACERMPCVTIQLDTHFMSAVRSGEFVQARGTITARTGSMVFMEGLMQVEDRSVLAARAILKVLHSPR